MNPAEMIVAIVALVVIGGVLRTRFTAHAPRDTAATPSDDDARRLSHEVQQLKDRIQVLERVITDNRRSVDLESEIERLRDR